MPIICYILSDLHIHKFGCAPHHSYQEVSYTRLDPSRPLKHRHIAWAGGTGSQGTCSCCINSLPTVTTCGPTTHPHVFMITSQYSPEIDSCSMTVPQQWPWKTVVKEQIPSEQKWWYVTDFSLHLRWIYINYINFERVANYYFRYPRTQKE